MLALPYFPFPSLLLKTPRSLDLIPRGLPLPGCVGACASTRPADNASAKAEGNGSSTRSVPLTVSTGGRLSITGADSVGFGSTRGGQGNGIG